MGQTTDAVSESAATATIPVAELTAVAPAMEAWHGWSGFIQLLPGEQSRRAPAFIPSHEMPNRDWFAHLHAQTAELPPLGCHLVRHAQITGHGYVFAGGRLVTQDVYLHGVAAGDLAARPELAPDRVPTRRCRHIEQPVLEILGPGSPVYGHWLVDFLPRAAIARETLGDAYHRLLVPIPDDLPDWTIELLRHFTGFRPQNALRYNAATEILSCSRLCIPTFGHAGGGYFFHSFVRDFYARSLPRHPAGRNRRICLSRRNFEQQTRGVLKGFNERLHLEQAAAARGFQVVCPEELNLDQQIELFSSAGIVVGEYGSALHNTLFSPARTVVGAVRYPNSVQTRIAGLMGQDVVYLIPDQDGIDARGAEIYSVSPDKIDRFLDQLTALHLASLVPPGP